MDKIIKRDGRTVVFEREKIVSAVYKAMQAAGLDDIKRAQELATQVEVNLGNTPSVEQIQDSVESVLVANNLVQTAKEFILYRAERTRVRESGTRLMRTIEDLTFKSAAENEQKRENANIDGDTAMGTMLKYGSETAKAFYEMSILNPLHSKMHKDGDIHIHDLDFLTLTTTCCQIDLDKLFEGGFCTGHGFLRSPNHIASYASLACIAIQSNQNDQHGGQSIPNFDYSLAKGVAKTYAKLYQDNLIKAVELLCGIDIVNNINEIFSTLKQNSIIPTLDNNNDYINIEKQHLTNLNKEHSIINERLITKCQTWAKDQASKETERATYQAMEALIHNLNTMHSRAGAQIPFSSINYGTDTTAEGRMVIRNVLKATESGLGNGETPIFPIQIFKVKDGINYKEQDPNYDLFKLACRCSAKRLFPNFSFLDSTFNLQYYKMGQPNTEIAYMGCRTRVIGNSYDKDNEVVTGRGNLSFTSINLPRLALKANGNKELFFEQLDRNIEIVVAQLLERYKIQSSKKVKNFPFLMGQGVWLGSEKLGAEDEIGEILKHGTLSVGFIGLAEALKALLGKHHGESAVAQNLGLEIIGLMRRRMDSASVKYKLNFSLIATPAEGLSGRFVKIDAKKYGIIEGVTDKEYYTNSFHIPVYYKITANKKIDLEAPYHNFTNGGHISYIELDGDTVHNPQVFEKIIRYMKEKNMGYGSINHPVDRDSVCGYTGVIKDTCPQCGRKENNLPFERIRRITGYLVGTVDRFNNGKKAEEKDRVKHGIK